MIDEKDIPMNIEQIDIQNKTEKYYSLRRCVQFAMVPDQYCEICGGNYSNQTMYVHDITGIYVENGRGKFVQFTMKCRKCGNIDGKFSSERIYSGLLWTEFRAMMVEGIDREGASKMDRIISALETIALGVKLGKAEVRVEIKDSIIQRSSICMDDLQTQSEQFANHGGRKHG